MLPRPPLGGSLGRIVDGAVERRLVAAEDGRGGNAGGTADGDDLVPVAVEVVAEDDQEVSGLGRLERALDGIHLPVDLRGDPLLREAGGDQALADQGAALARPPAAAVVVLAQDDEVERRRGGPGEL